MWFIYNTIIKNVVLDVYYIISDVSYVSHPAHTTGYCRAIFTTWPSVKPVYISYWTLSLFFYNYPTTSSLQWMGLKWTTTTSFWRSNEGGWILKISDVRWQREVKRYGNAIKGYFVGLFCVSSRHVKIVAVILGAQFQNSWLEVLNSGTPTNSVMGVV